MYGFYESINECRNTALENNDRIAYFQSLFGNNDLYYFNHDNNMIYEYEKFDKIDNILPFYLINKEEIEKHNNLKEIKSTAFKTGEIPENKNYHEPEIYTPNDILNIFNKESNKDKFKFFTKLNIRKDIEDNLQLPNQKRNREKSDSDELCILIQNIEYDENKIKRGRKTNITNKNEIHDKMYADNIIKKIKAKLFKYCLHFLNNILNKIDRVKLLKLNYNIIYKMKKEIEIDLLNMNLKDIFSKEISNKYNIKNYGEDYNKRIIDNILNNVNDSTILFALNMTLKDWLDIFTFKKTVKDIVNKYNNINLENINLEIIENSLIGVDKLLLKIYESNISA